MDFTPVYKEYWTKVYRLCMGYVNDPEWARDIAQDTFIIVWQQLPAFRQESAIGTWIFTIACNNCLRQLERSRRLIKKELPPQLEDRPDPSVEEKVNYLYRCIAALKETDRLIISLELEDIKQAGIAAILGMPESSVRVRIHRIKEKLAKKFKSYEH
jgi:RNA polymerase sigma-70 factor (ECF subfamily)